jgi:hypothetical protein
MRTMVRSLLVVAVLGTTAAAQPAAPAPPGPSAPAAPAAPSSTAPAAPATPVADPANPMAPAPPSTVPPVAAPAPFDVMADRWSVNLQFGWHTFTVQHAEKPQTTFGSFALSGRYRIIPTIEIGVMLLGGGSDDKLSLGGFYFEGRYRFRADRPWNFYGALGLGGTAVAHKEANDTEKKARGSLYVGAGVERRFRRFAFDLEVHIAGVGENKDLTEPVPMPITRAYELERYGLSGGGVIFGVLYYF